MDIKRYVQLYDYISPHGIDAITVSVLQSTEMGLIRFVKKILAGYGKFDTIVSEKMDIGPEGKMTDGIVFGRSLCLFKGEVVVLTQVIFHPE